MWVCATYAHWLKMIVRGEKTLLFLPPQLHSIGLWMALTKVGTQRVKQYVIIGDEISVSQAKHLTGLSLRGLKHIGYESRYRIYPIVERRAPKSKLYIPGNVSPLPVKSSSLLRAVLKELEVC